MLAAFFVLRLPVQIVIQAVSDELIELIKREVSALDITQLRNALTESRIKSETVIINNLIGRIQEFRM